MGRLFGQRLYAGVTSDLPHAPVMSESVACSAIV